MNIQKILPLLTLAAVVAQAEVKHVGEVVERQCGQMTRTTRVCLSDIKGKGKLALEITTHVPGPTDIPVSYKTMVGIVYDAQTIAADGATTKIYKALVPTQVEGSYKIIYQEVELRVVQVIVPNAEPTAKVYVNGKLQYGRGFGWGDVASTASAEPANLYE